MRNSWILYHWCPYDHAIGYQLVDPVYITIKLLALIPFFGTQALIYGILFMLHDKKDDYQMVKFILDFKGCASLALAPLPLIFSYNSEKCLCGTGCRLSPLVRPDRHFPLCHSFPRTHMISRCAVGIFGTLIGGYQYAYCANQHPPNCQIRGPGAGRFFYTGLLGWLGCAALVWAAFSMLTCKKCRKGGDRFSGGGRLSHWVAYDILCMAFAVGVVGMFACFSQTDGSLSTLTLTS
eukprot:COSAG03_NODE_1829_length_3462_cov_17.521855_3_plen_236_part_00